MHTTYSVHAGILKPWRGPLPWLLVVFPFYHVFSLPLSGLNWRSLFPPWGSGPPFPKMAPPFTGSAHTPLPGSRTIRIANGILQALRNWTLKQQLHNILCSYKIHVAGAVEAVVDVAAVAAVAAAVDAAAVAGKTFTQRCFGNCASCLGSRASCLGSCTSCLSSSDRGGGAAAG